MNKFAQILKALMKEKKLTAGELAEYLGLARSSVSMYCTGKATPKADTIIKLANYFGVTCDYLLTGGKQESQELGLSGDAIRLLKQCQDERVRELVDRLLGVPDFYEIVHNDLNTLGIFITEKQIDLTIKSLIKVHRGDSESVTDDILAFLSDKVLHLSTSFMFEKELEIFGGFDVIDARVRAVTKELQVAPVSLE